MTDSGKGIVTVTSSGNQSSDGAAVVNGYFDRRKIINNHYHSSPSTDNSVSPLSTQVRPKLQTSAHQHEPSNLPVRQAQTGDGSENLAKKFYLHARKKCWWISMGIIAMIVAAAVVPAVIPKRNNSSQSISTVDEGLTLSSTFAHIQTTASPTNTTPDPTPNPIITAVSSSSATIPSTLRLATLFSEPDYNAGSNDNGTSFTVYGSDCKTWKQDVGSFYRVASSILLYSGASCELRLRGCSSTQQVVLGTFTSNTTRFDPFVDNRIGSIRCTVNA